MDEKRALDRAPINGPRGIGRSRACPPARRIGAQCPPLEYSSFPDPTSRKPQNIVTNNRVSLLTHSRSFNFFSSLSGCKVVMARMRSKPIARAMNKAEAIP